MYRSVFIEGVGGTPRVRIVKFYCKQILGAYILAHLCYVIQSLLLSTMGNFVSKQRARLFSHYARDYAQTNGGYVRLMDEDQLAQEIEIENGILSKYLLLRIMLSWLFSSIVKLLLHCYRSIV